MKTLTTNKENPKPKNKTDTATNKKKGGGGPQADLCVRDHPKKQSREAAFNKPVT